MNNHLYKGKIILEKFRTKAVVALIFDRHMYQTPRILRVSLFIARE